MCCVRLQGPCSKGPLRFVEGQPTSVPRLSLGHQSLLLRSSALPYKYTSGSRGELRKYGKHRPSAVNARSMPEESHHAQPDIQGCSRPAVRTPRGE